MKIVCHGCTETKYYWPCWPKFLEFFTNNPVLNMANFDSDNHSISRSAIDSAIKFKSTISHMYIMWTSDTSNSLQTLENILRTQHFLSSYTLRYTMMIYNNNILDKDCKLYQEIDWSKFIFYKNNKGLEEYSNENFSEYKIKDEFTPPPIAQFYWVKNIMFNSELILNKMQMDNLSDWANHVTRQKNRGSFFNKITNSGPNWTLLDGDKK